MQRHSPLVIVWLNGPFGVGKTATGRALAGRVPGARVVDPERIGFVMRRTFWRQADYQDAPAWRWLTRLAVARAGRRGPVIVAMTVIERVVFEEVTPRAQVFALVASPETMESRIAGTGEAQVWRRQNLHRCLTAFSDDALGQRSDTDRRTPAEVADALLDQLDGAGWGASGRQP